MKKKQKLSCITAAAVLLLPCAVTAGGDDLVLESGVDFNPGDGFMEQGSPSNPYVVRDRGTGRDTGLRIKSQMEDFNPGDGFMDKGTAGNPYIIERVTPQY